MSKGRDFLGILGQLRLAWALFRDRRLSIWPKALPVLTLAYLIWPLDGLPDLALGLGQLDDLAVIALGLSLFTAVCPARLVQEHTRRLAGDPLAGQQGEVVDTTYRVWDDATDRHDENASEGPKNLP